MIKFADSLYTKVKLVSILILMTILVLALVLFNSFKYKDKKVELNIEQKSTVVMRIVPATQSPLPIINDSVKRKELEPKQEVRPKTIEKVDAPKEKPLKKIDAPKEKPLKKISAPKEPPLKKINAAPRKKNKSPTKTVKTKKIIKPMQEDSAKSKPLASNTQTTILPKESLNNQTLTSNSQAKATQKLSESGANTQKHALKSLIDRIEKLKEYPRQARVNQIEGKCQLLIVIKNSTVIETSLKQKSNSSILNRACLKLAHKIQGFTLETPNFSKTVITPIIYTLDN